MPPRARKARDIAVATPPEEDSARSLGSVAHPCHHFIGSRSSTGLSCGHILLHAPHSTHFFGSITALRFSSVSSTDIAPNWHESKHAMQAVQAPESQTVIVCNASI